MVRAWYGRGMASVNQTRPHCVNQMGKTHSKPLAAQHGRGMLCVNLPIQCTDYKTPQLEDCMQPAFFQMMMLHHLNVYAWREW